MTDDDLVAGGLPTGDRLETLIALRDDLARRIPSAADRDAATLARQLTEIMAAIAELQPADEAESPLAVMLQAVPD